LDKQARFESIREMTARFTTVLLCKIAEVSRAGYYKWLTTYEDRQARLDDDTVLKEHILAIHRIRPHYGYFRMRTALRKEGLAVNHKKVRGSCVNSGFSLSFVKNGPLRVVSLRCYSPMY
jgi:putative transposase